MVEALLRGVLCLSGVFAGAVPAAAITRGLADGDTHPSVALTPPERVGALPSFA